MTHSERFLFSFSKLDLSKLQNGMQYPQYKKAHLPMDVHYKVYRAPSIAVGDIVSEFTEVASGFAVMSPRSNFGGFPKDLSRWVSTFVIQLKPANERSN